MRLGRQKCAWITIEVTNFLANKELNFVLIGTCDPETTQLFMQKNVFLYGNVLTMRSSVDEFAGSCQKLFVSPRGRSRAVKRLCSMLARGAAFSTTHWMNGSFPLSNGLMNKQVNHNKFTF